jgi:hypothetical protein
MFSLVGEKLTVGNNFKLSGEQLDGERSASVT